MKIRRLDWDSDFFGLQIGRIDLQSTDDLAHITTIRDELATQYDLIYVFDPIHIGCPLHGAQLVDHKVLYHKSCVHKCKHPEVMEFKPISPTPSLYRLALVSGEYSRFRLDQRFPEGSFERLYNRWIENACPMEGTNRHIFAYFPQEVAQGMITFDYDEKGLAHIGLVATAPECQHQGIATMVMDTVEEYLFRIGLVHTIEVPTQLANLPACRWYEKNGFTIKNITDIYHWWLR